jgi:hypothetical protein
MCINAETSLLSFLIGEMSGLVLLTKDVEHQMIGLFVMFYSLVQFFEFNIYNGNKVEMNSRLLLLNLGFQGLVFFILINQICEINKFYIFISVIIVFLILMEAFSDNFNSVSIETCAKWNFMNNHLSSILTIMYGMMFYWFYISNSCNLDFINKTGYFFSGTLVLSFIISQQPNNPSFWCLSSALLAPLLLLL